MANSNSRKKCRVLSKERREEIIEYRENKQDLDSFCKEELLSENFMRVKDKMNWTNISSLIGLPEEFIIKYKDKIDWNILLAFSHLSEDLIRKCKDYIDWSNPPIYVYQELSEKFLLEFKYIVDWDVVSKFQNLSLDFIKKNYKMLNTELLLENEQISDDIKDKIKNGEILK